MGDVKKQKLRLNVFKSFTLKWWQGAFFKWGVLCLGIVIGAEWYAFFDDYLLLLTIIAAACLAYISFVWWKQ